jgi:S-DNA-T family DNA segregation ATPase FtsK/SpoIIIE
MALEKAPEKVGKDIAKGTNQLTSRLVSQAREKTAAARSLPQLPKNKSVALLVIDGPLKGKTFPIDKPQISIGRSQADIVIEDAKMSRTHCVLEVHDLAALLVDLDSANGTFVDGRKIASCELGHLSEFRVGETTILLAFTSRV